MTAAETRAMQKALLLEAVLLAKDIPPPPPQEALATHRRSFQTVFVVSIAGGQYATQNTHSFVSYPRVAGLDTYDHEFRLMCRVALDGKEGDIPLETRARIVCALRYKP